MKLLFNLDVVEGNKLKARPGDYLQALPAKQQITEVEAFLQWAEDAAKKRPGPTGTGRGRDWRCHCKGISRRHAKRSSTHLYRRLKRA